jgi:hypothetical protein
MAFREPVSPAVAELLFPFMPFRYNLDRAVGFGKANVADDVMVVQLFLKMVYENPNWQAGHPLAGKLKPTGDMVVDGICGPITRGWIIRYQQDWELTVDGVVNKAVEGFQPVVGEVRRFFVWTIRQLDSDYAIARPQFCPRIGLEPAAPPLLRAKFG